MELAKKKKYFDQLSLQTYQKANQNPRNIQTLSQILTKSEKILIGRRILIAQAILSGKTRRELQDKIGISPNTFAQINYWLENELKEYQAFTTSDRKHARTNHIKKFSYKDLKQKYPIHFLLFSIAESVWKQGYK